MAGKSSNGGKGQKGPGRGGQGGLKKGGKQATKEIQNNSRAPKRRADGVDEEIRIDLQADRVLDTIKTMGYHSIALEGPEGLKPSLIRLALKIEKETGVNVIVLGEPCRGPCDLRSEAIREAIDAAFHFSHTQTTRSKVKVHYIETRVPPSPNWDKKMQSLLKLLEQKKKIGLLTTPPYFELAEIVEKNLKKRGFTVIKEREAPFKKAGQILGCDARPAESVESKVDVYLYVGDGLFHPVGVALKTGKPVLQIGPETGPIDVAEKAERLLRKRLTIIEKAREKKVFGVVIGLKRGQKRVKEALDIKEKLQRHGYTAILVAMDEITGEKIMNLQGIEALVITACPRVALEDQENLGLPAITSKEALYMLGLRDRYEPF